MKYAHFDVCEKHGCLIINGDCPRCAYDRAETALVWMKVVMVVALAITCLLAFSLVMD